MTSYAFLEAAMPLLGLRWKGYRRVWRSVGRRARARAQAAGCATLDVYLARLAVDPAECERARVALSVTASRFHRRAHTFEAVCDEALAWPAREVRAWSAGCASGEEPYTLAMTWRERVLPARPDLPLSILATDVSDEALERARRGVYSASSVRGVPESMRAQWFARVASGWRIADAIREQITFRRHDLLVDDPPRAMSIIFCRNVIFTNFGDALRARALASIATSLRPGGLLAIDEHERGTAAPTAAAGFTRVPGHRALYRKSAQAAIL
ncbi:MAG: hypothetical protein HYR85_18485 [Planctomycetes bacterium]|nr:hypothetical protein [Planctomycetota bacterium]MBI3843370.1 hypothetical protein [Planctomycetota bacterium]